MSQTQYGVGGGFAGNNAKPRQAGASQREATQPLRRKNSRDPQGTYKMPNQGAGRASSVEMATVETQPARVYTPEADAEMQEDREMTSIERVKQHSTNQMEYRQALGVGQPRHSQ